MQIVRGGKLLRFSQIYFQSRKFSSENFLSHYKVFLGLKMVDRGPGSGPGLLRYFKPCRKDSCKIPRFLRQRIDLLDYLAHFYIQVACQGRVSNYPHRCGNLECSYSFKFCHYYVYSSCQCVVYAREYRKLLVTGFSRGFQTEAVMKVFQRITKRA